MKYILDSNGYVESASCNPISCDDKVSQEYKGTIPDGYETLDEWILYANIRAYKIVNNNLVYDAARDAELQAEWEKAAQNIPPVVLFEGNTTGNIVLKDDLSNYSYIEIFYGNSDKTLCNNTKVFTDSLSVTLMVCVTTTGHFWINSTELLLETNQLTVSRCGSNDVNNYAYAVINANTTSVINVFKVLGYK